MGFPREADDMNAHMNSSEFSKLTHTNCVAAILHSLLRPLYIALIYFFKSKWFANSRALLLSVVTYSGPHGDSVGQDTAARTGAEGV